VKLTRRIVTSGVVILCVAVGIFVFSDRILWSLGAILDAGEPPRKADMAVVIGGDSEGNRILLGAELVRTGYVPKVFVSGMAGMYGYFESDLAIAFAVKHGYPREAFIAFHRPAVSTLDEARGDIPELRRLGVHEYLLVTSAYHTARAGRIFRREGGDLDMHVISASDRNWQNGQWWKDREGRKVWFNEMLKTIADCLRI
jgi:uncharacterized SAM-binding protein YcdF (DUF218 family)